MQANCLLTSLISKVINAPHKAKLSHEVIAAAASYEVRYPLFDPKHADHLLGHESVE